MCRNDNLKKVMVAFVLLLISVCFGCAQGSFPLEETQAKPGGRTLGPTESAETPASRPLDTETDTSASRPEALPPIQLTVETPTRGASLDQTQVQVSGVVRNLGSGQVLVNGQVSTVDEAGRFSATITSAKGLNRIVTEVQRGQEYAEDRRSFIFGARSDPSDKIEQAVTIHLGAQGLARLGEIVARSVEALDIGEIIRNSGGDSDDFKVKRVTFSGLSVRLVPQNGRIRIRLDIHDLELKFRGKFRILFIPVVVHGRVNADVVKIESDLQIRKTTEGSLGLDLSNSDVDLNGFRFQIDNVADALTGLFRDTARSEGEKLLKKTLKDFVVPALFQEELLSQEVDIMGKRLGIDLDVESISTDSNGVSLLLGSRVSVDQPVRQMGIVPAQIPPASRNGADSIKIASSIDFINRLLVSAWSSGAFDLELSTEEPGLEAFGVPVLKIALAEAGETLQADDVLTYRIRPLLPPVASIDKSGAPLRVDLGDAMLDVIGPSGVLVTIALDISLGVGLSATSNPDLVIEPELAISIAADVASMPLGQVNETLLESQIETIAQLLPELIADETLHLSESDDDVPFKLIEMVFGASTSHWLELFAGFDVN